MKTEAMTLTGFYQTWLARLQDQPLSVEGMDDFNADIQRAIDVPHRDAAIKTELATLKLKANRWFHHKKRALAR